MASTDRPNLKVEQSEAEVVVTLIDCSVLNETTTPAIDSQLTGLAGELRAARLTLDLDGIRYASSTALAMCLALHHTLKDAGGRFGVRGLSDEIYEVFDVTGLTRVFDVARKA
jgi:anti-anti-sigma factor